MNPDELPYPYTKNTGAFSGAYAVITGVVTIALCGFAYFGLTPWAAAAIPAAILAVRVWLFTLIFNAVHLGLRSAELDAILDESVADEIAERAKRTLTPGFMTEAMIRTAEEGAVH
jgi:hypothetical protein